MKHYYFYNYTDKYGRHEVHSGDCSYLPSLENRTYIGYFANCQQAIYNAKLKYPSKSFDGCYWCSNICHVG